MSVVLIDCKHITQCQILVCNRCSTRNLLINNVKEGIPPLVKNVTFVINFYLG